MTEGVRTAALAAAVAVGDRYGLPTGAPEVLNDGSNLLVRLGSVVARVATTTALIRPGVEAWLARDVALARFAAERGVPVISPCDDPPAGPHIVDGLAVTLWPFTRHDRGEVASPGEVGRLLGELHQVLRDFPGEMPAGGTSTDVLRMLDLLDTPSTPAAELARLRARAAEVISRAAAASADRPSQVLHGDPHPANLLLTSAGPRWIDFEDAYFGRSGGISRCCARPRCWTGAPRWPPTPARRPSVTSSRSSRCASCRGCAGC